MIHTKKRILAMLLAVVLCFSALPFSVSADEVSSELPTESTVESQPKESQAEKEESSQTENSIIISDSSGDVPVLYAQDPFNTVKSEVEGGTNYMTSVGVTRQAIVRELEAHENDDFYLGTKYVGGDAQSPNGDASYPMNFFEKELRNLFGSSPMLRDAHYCGRTCLAKLDEELRVKLQFTTTGYADHYDAIKLAVINRTDGVVDQQLFRFSDIIGQQAVRGRDPINPHIWDYNGRLEWYRTISQEQRSQIANTILDYVGMYQEETEENDFTMKL